MARAITYDRQTLIFDPAQFTEAHVAIIGVGNIGSNVAIQLVRLGIRHLTLYDPDTVEAHNLSSQHYLPKHIGKSKVDALEEQIHALAKDCTVHTFPIEYRGEDLEAPILVSAVDSVDIRRDILAGMVASGYDPYVIDGRAGGGQVEVYSQPRDEWGPTIPEQADDDPCGGRFITYASAIVGAMIANQVKRKLSDQTVKPRVLFHCDSYQILTP